MWKIPAAMSEITVVSIFFKKGQIPGKASLESKEANDCWDFLKNALFFLKAQKQFIPFKGKGCRRNKSPLGFNCEVLSLLKSKAYQRWKYGSIPIENYVDIARVCKDGVRKEKARLQVNLAKMSKNTRMGSLGIKTASRNRRQLLSADKQDRRIRHW